MDLSSLNMLLQYGIINPDSVQDKAMQIKQLLSLHPYAITAPASETGRWQTFYKDANGKRKNLKAPTKEQLIKKLITIYSANSIEKKLTFSKLYQEWLEYKQTITNSPNTIKRHEQHYKKYFLNSSLNNAKISNIDEIMLEQACNTIVKKNNLSRKEWTNVKTILKGMYEYAYRKHYIKENPIPNVRVSVKFRQINKKTGATQTFNSDELKDLNSYLDQMYNETKDSSFIAVRINLLLGLRVSELVTLRWDDISEKHIHIVREEIRDQITNEYHVVEHTKTNTDRFVALIPKAQKLLQLLEPSTSEYIFTRDNQRLHSRQIAYVLERYAQQRNKPVKSTHKMRKTYASNLNAHGVPLDCIREQLGHSNLTTTLSYIYNPLTEQETFDMISNAL